MRRKDKRCTFELINGKKLSVSSRLAVGGRYMIDYNEAVLRHDTMLNKGINDGYIEKEPYTKGRLTDGVK